MADPELEVGARAHFGALRARRKSSPQPHALTLSKTAEHFTPPWLLALVREVMGAIDLDPCSCADAQANVGAARWYSADDDGLSRRWAGRVFINPPGDRRGKLPKQFWSKLVAEVASGRVTEVTWLAFNLAQLRTLQIDDALLPECDVCVLRERIRFTGDSPTKDNAVLYWGPNRDRFADAFGRAGAIWCGRSARESA
jgi:hypothetical protein